MVVSQCFPIFRLPMRSDHFVFRLPGVDVDFRKRKEEYRQNMAPKAEPDHEQSIWPPGIPMPSTSWTDQEWELWLARYR